MATYAIGDIQGCFDDFQRLLQKLDYSPSRDRLWIAGDLVNRGPRSLDSLRFIKNLGAEAICVLGNHDLHMLSAYYNPASHHRKDTIMQIVQADDREELIDWVCEQPLIHRDTQLGFTMIHAGLVPEWTIEKALSCAAEMHAVLRSHHLYDFLDVMYGNQPDQWSDKLEGHDRLRCITNIFSRLRFCTADGRMALKEKGPPGSQPPGYHPWFDIKERKSKDERIVFGHWSTLGDYPTHNVYPLDTGCLWGGRLTALRLAEHPEWIQVECQGERNPTEF